MPMVTAASFLWQRPAFPDEYPGMAALTPGIASSENLLSRRGWK